MSAATSDPKAIFFAALEQPSPAERSRYLDSACGGDPQLRSRVEQLLAAHDQAGHFLGGSGATAAPTDHTSEVEGSPPPECEMQLDFLLPSQQPGHLGRLGHYEVVEVVGRGGMGIVLRAIDEKLQRVVAIKVMAPQLATSAAARKRFSREAQAAAAVSHDHVVTIHAVEEAGGLPYLAMQYVSGMSLQERLDKSGPLELREIVRIGMQTAAGLAAAHAQGLIHRDIKPANILLENGVERVKITDFGLARAVADASMTQTGMVAGTPQYMSPEQARGEAVDRRSDLFSLGSVLYAMCTGRPPFRADSGIAVLKRVCDDTPRPIRETNPEIPKWLVAVVAKLHAKDPADRYQSAAEVAELLNGHLAHLQHHSVVPLPAVEKPARHVPVRRRLWATAAAMVLCIAAGLGLTEAAGVTKLTASVIRVLTPSGTLVVEVDDPGVSVTVEGDGGLVITGAGPQEVRLRPGSYKVRATKDGKSVREEELITITRGDKRVVKVSHEAASTTATPTTVGPVDQPFVRLGGKDVPERRFDTLAEAVLSSGDGDTIEVRGNGPFASRPISIEQNALTIRAGQGFRPVIKLNPAWLQDDVPLIRSNASLVLEGLELHRVPPAGQRGKGSKHVIHCFEAPLWAANCRFRYSVRTKYSPACVFQNCEFLSEEESLSAMCRPGAQLTVENCLHLSGWAGIFLNYDDAALHDLPIQLKHATIVGKGHPVWLGVRSLSPNPSERPGAAKPIRVQVSDTIFDAGSVLAFGQIHELPEKAEKLQPADAEATLLHLFQWRGERNVFASGGASVKWSAALQQQPPRGPKSLEEWKQYWNSPETDSLEGRLRFQGGNLIARIDGGLDKVTPDDFRLLPDSPGYRAGKDGKDLGADVDLVGPGAAYERWKKTREYQQWLKDTAHVKKAETPKPELQAFALLGGKAVAEKKFDTLAEAVVGASDGDTIEVRGNGPFVTGPIVIWDKALVIRAGLGTRPVLKPSPAALDSNELFLARAPLVLEGIEIHWTTAGQPRRTNVRNLVTGTAAVCVANCRMIVTGRTNTIYVNSEHCELRNCEFLLDHDVNESVGWMPRRNSRLIVDGCIIAGTGVSLELGMSGAPVEASSVQFTRNTATGGTATGLYRFTEVPDGMRQLSLRSADNVIASRRYMVLANHEPVAQQTPAAAKIFVKSLLSYEEQRNLYDNASNLLAYGQRTGGVKWLPLVQPASDIASWHQFWELEGTYSQTGVVRFQGGQLDERVIQDPYGMTPADFRLADDSAGYRAGPDGKDLGADIDLVGPGPAYERWKRTPEYQQWRKDTGQEK